jgi:hypothetical protein
MLVKLVCERCFSMYRSELENEGWFQELPSNELAGGICSMCGRVEGKRTLQFNAVEILGPLAAHGDKDNKDE